MDNKVYSDPGSSQYAYPGTGTGSGTVSKKASKGPSKATMGFVILLILIVSIVVVIVMQEEDTPSTPAPGVVWVAAGRTRPTAVLGGTSWDNMLYSLDGRVWQESSEDGASFSKNGWGVAYGNNRWVAVGDDLPGGSSWGNIMWSDNGTCWVETNRGHSFQIEGKGVDYGGNLWVAAGNNVQPTTGGTSFGNLKWSLDGICWVNSSGVSFEVMANTVKYNPNAINDVVWVAGGDNGEVDTNGAIKWSNNGTCWVDSLFNQFRSVNSVTVSDTNPPVWVAVGVEPTPGGNPRRTIQYSLTGKEWLPVNPDGAWFQNEGLAVEYGNGIFVATGDNGGADNILWSDTGTSFNVATGACFAPQGNGIAYGNGLFVATGDNRLAGGDDATNNILTSTDGKNWVVSSTAGATFDHSGLGVGYKS
jgi:hypothetical protein